MAAAVPPAKGRGATFNPANRFRREQREAVDDGWDARAPAAEDTPEGMLPASGADGQTHDRGRADDAPPPLKTVVRITHARTIIARNDSPDIPFSQSINPYQGCEHEIRTTRRAPSP